MGIAANQARLMTLTARQNDLEYKAQQISAIKMRLSQTTSTIAQNYANALNNYTTLNAAQQTANNNSGKKFLVGTDGSYILEPDDYKDAEGNVKAAYAGMTEVESTGLLQAVATALSVGTVTTANGYLTLEQGKYTTETESISAQEKIYDMELTQVNTEHDAIKTEYDAIKSLVGDNVEKSFNVFG